MGVLPYILDQYVLARLMSLACDDLSPATKAEERLCYPLHRSKCDSAAPKSRRSSKTPPPTEAVISKIAGFKPAASRLRILVCVLLS